MKKRPLIRQNGHLYYYEGMYATLKAAKKSAKSWQDYGSFTLIKPEKQHYLYPTMTKTSYLLYKTRRNIKK